MIHIWTFGTDPDKLIHLARSALMHDLKLNVLRTGVWSGFTDKIKGMISIIDKYEDDDIICFVDGYDVLVNSSLPDLERIFLGFDCDFVVSAELYGYPEKYKADFAQSKWTNFHYLNSGGYIGYKHAVKKFLLWKAFEEIEVICRDGGDQTYLAYYYIIERDHIKIQLDSECKIFLTMSGVDWSDLSIYRGKIYNDVLKNSPSFIHFNGGSDKLENVEGSMVRGILLKKLISENSRTALKLNEWHRDRSISNPVISQI
jgi:hypothetical protein